MVRTYDSGKREFKHLIKTLDGANAKLEGTMDMLRDIVVDPVFRPSGEEPRNLLDFVDEKSVDEMRNALKGSIGELQVRLAGLLPISGLAVLTWNTTGCPDLFRRRPPTIRDRPAHSQQDLDFVPITIVALRLGCLSAHPTASCGSNEPLPHDGRTPYISDLTLRQMCHSCADN